MCSALLFESHLPIHQQGKKEVKVFHLVAVAFVGTAFFVREVELQEVVVVEGFGEGFEG